MPVRRAQRARITSGSVSRPAGISRTSKHTKSFPDPLIFQNSRLAGGRGRADKRVMQSPLGSDLSRDCPPAKPPHHPDGLANDAPRHLALAFTAIGENDRNLDDPETAFPRPEAHLDLKRVTIGSNGR